MKQIRLDDIAIACGTDKSSLYHGYTKIYEMYLDPIRNNNIYLLELGWGGHNGIDYCDPNLGGQSAVMWRDYFKSAFINIADVNYKYNPHVDIRFIHSSQENCHANFRNNYFDVIIDDASHIPDLTIKSLETLWRVLKPGGLYFIEDTHASYDPFYEGSNPNPNEGITIMTFVKRILDGVNNDYLKDKIPFDFEFVHFYKDLIVLRKKL